uniref:Amino acid transporter transmembrane domain-containing protein n=2 Tax=Amorphochlora amoebiformis TaxID=1561963 RepID=A0A7S0DDL8_9EUKA|mmetsp:Transcript_23364/g.36707  ORF Transcript_23364/g.36707 Transcript_23364/m.36707 type:complete len:252 (+) Transcript_23364:44-799(+)
MFGIFVFMALVLGVAYKGVPELINQDFDPPYLLAGEGTTWGVLSALPMVMYSYCCHINVFSIYTELQRPSIRKMSNVVLLSCGVASVLYVVLAITGLSQFRNETKEDILSNLGHREPVMGGLQILMAINIGLGFPMNVYPSRFTIEMLFFPDAKPSLSRRYTITGVFVGLAVIIAVYLPKISTVFSILGASSAVLVSFTLPSGFYVYIRTGSVVSLNEISASLLFIASLIFGILATTASVVSSISPNVIEK